MQICDQDQQIHNLRLNLPEKMLVKEDIEEVATKIEVGRDLAIEKVRSEFLNNLDTLTDETKKKRTIM